MRGSGVGSLAVYQQELGRGLLPALLWIRSRNQGDQWKEAEVDIKGYHQYKVNCIVIIFLVQKTVNYNWDLCICWRLVGTSNFLKVWTTTDWGPFLESPENFSGPKSLL